MRPKLRLKHSYCKAALRLFGKVYPNRVGSPLADLLYNAISISFRVVLLHFRKCAKDSGRWKTACNTYKGDDDLQPVADILKCVVPSKEKPDNLDDDDDEDDEIQKMPKPDKKCEKQPLGEKKQKLEKETKQKLEKKCEKKQKLELGDLNEKKKQKFDLGDLNEKEKKNGMLELGGLNEKSKKEMGDLRVLNEMIKHKLELRDLNEKQLLELGEIMELGDQGLRDLNEKIKHKLELGEKQKSLELGEIMELGDLNEKQNMLELGEKQKLELGPLLGELNEKEKNKLGDEEGKNGYMDSLSVVPFQNKNDVDVINWFQLQSAVPPQQLWQVKH